MSAPRPGRWTSPPQKARAHYFLLLSAVNSVGIAARVIYLIIEPDTKKTPLLILALPAFFGACVVLYYLINESRIRRVVKEDAARSERPEGLAEFLVEIDVRRLNDSLGIDRGVIYFENGLMGFVGSSASFLLAEEDIVRPKGLVLVNWDRLFRPLRLRAEDEKMAVTVKPLFGYGRPYRKALKAFLREKKVTDSERQWPPTVPYGKEEPKPPVLSNMLEAVGTNAAQDDVAQGAIRA